MLTVAVRTSLLSAALLGASALRWGAEREPPPPPAPEHAFPVTWTGTWSGDLLVVRGDDTLQRTGMRLAIAPLDGGRYSWALGYGEPGADERPYVLSPDTTASGRWRIDERNGVVLDASLHAGVLYSRFAVMGELLLTRDELRGDTLHHEIVSGRLAPVATGDVVVAGDTIPPVGSYPVDTRQFARLTRVGED